MNKNNHNAGTQFVSLLKQRRNLYYQLKVLMDEQSQLVDSSSPELVLKILTGRRKLIEKLRQLEAKIGLIKSNWSKISSQVASEHKQQARLMLEQAEKIAKQISIRNLTDSSGNLPVCEFDTLDELLVE
jgi:flagellar biosynthesis/type III secretory pathway chaperone